MQTARASRPAGGFGREVATVLAVALLVAALGAPLGWVWALVAPHTRASMGTGGAYLDLETGSFAGADVWFVLLGLGAGLVLPIVCWSVVRRYRGPVMLVGLAAGCLGSSLLARWIGGLVGRSDYQYLLHHARSGWTFDQPLALGAGGGLVVQALLAVFVYTVLAGWSRYAALSAERELESALPGPGGPAGPWPEQPAAAPTGPVPTDTVPTDDTTRTDPAPAPTTPSGTTGSSAPPIPPVTERSGLPARPRPRPTEPVPSLGVPPPALGHPQPIRHTQPLGRPRAQPGRRQPPAS